MSAKLVLNETILNVICAYVCQVGCEEEEKDAFSAQMDEELKATLESERAIVGVDLKGNVGKSRDVTERVHGGRGIGEKERDAKQTY